MLVIHSKLLFHRSLVVRVPVTGLLRNLGPPSRLAHDNAVHAKHGNGGFRCELDSPLFGGDRIIDLVSVSIESSVGLGLNGRQLISVCRI